VSYALAVAGDALADFRAIDVLLQERTWDELELLAADPSRLTFVSYGNIAIHEFVHSDDRIVARVAITLIRNDAARTLTVLGLAVETLP